MAPIVADFFVRSLTLRLLRRLTEALRPAHLVIVAKTVYSSVLARALELDGSTQSLATYLNVPEPTLQRWLAGTALMPFRAFMRVLDFVVERESKAAVHSPGVPSPAQTKLIFSVGELLARCAACGATDFRPAKPDLPVKMTSALQCCACGVEVRQGDLLAALAKQATRLSRARADGANERLRAREARTAMRGTVKPSAS
jgi:hypothetical protein